MAAPVIRRLALPVAYACSAAGAWALHRLGAEGRRFVRDLTAEFLIDVAMSHQPYPPAPRRHR